MLHRPHDRVPLIEMKEDWNSCLNNRVGFKVYQIPFSFRYQVFPFQYALSAVYASGIDCAGLCHTKGIPN